MGGWPHSPGSGRGAASLLEFLSTPGLQAFSEAARICLHVALLCSLLLTLCVSWKSDK